MGEGGQSLAESGIPSEIDEHELAAFGNPITCVLDEDEHEFRTDSI